MDKELTAISESYLKLLNTKAISLLASNDLYVSQYVKLDFKKNDIEADRNVLGSGQLMLRFKKDKGIPRKNEYFTAVILEKDMCLPKNWVTLPGGSFVHTRWNFPKSIAYGKGKPMIMDSYCADFLASP